MKRRRSAVGTLVSRLESARNKHERRLRGTQPEARPRVLRVARKRDQLQPRNPKNGLPVNIESILPILFPRRLVRSALERHAYS